MSSSTQTPPSVAQPQISKSKKSKKKTTTNLSTPTAAHDTPTTLLESSPETPSAAPVPALVSGTKDEGSGSQPAAESARVGTEKKGPVEEMISKRLRLLGKKIQRFKTYSSSPPEKLNADQKAALASLPTLEGAWKELDDVMKFVEIIELEQASKVRERKAEDDKNLEKVFASKIAEFQAALAKPLSLFLRLHTLLHPARPSDQTHLTFGRLTLPSALQDEVQATDILRVGRMYEDILAGGEEAQKVLDSLVNQGADEEDERVHYLLKLLDQPEPIIEEGDAIPSNQDQEVDIVAETVEEEKSIPESEIIQPTSIDTSRAPSALGAANILPNGHEGMNFTSNSVDGDDDIASSTVVEAPQGQGAALNFLQDDELDKAQNIEDGYEVLDLPPAHEHQTSGLQPPPVQSSSVPDAHEEVVRSEQTTAPAPLDWTAEDDADDTVEAERIRSVFASGAATPAAQPSSAPLAQPIETLPESAKAVASDIPTPESSVEPTSAVQPLSTAASVPPSANSAPSPPTSAKPHNRRKPTAHFAQQTPNSQAQSHPHPQATGTSKKNEPIVVVDEDGFEMKIRRPSAAQRGRGGRGGPGAGAGGAGGRGGGAGRGRGAPRDGPRTPSNRQNAPSDSHSAGLAKPISAPTHALQTAPNGTPNSNGPRPNRGPRPAQTQNGAKPQQQQQQQAKPSIYKAAQPNGPASAPIF